MLAVWNWRGDCRTGQGSPHPRGWMAQASRSAHPESKVTCIAASSCAYNVVNRVQHQDTRSYATPNPYPRPLLIANMSGRLVAGRLSTLARRSPLLTPRFYTTHSLPAGGLLRNEAGIRLVKRRPWPLGSYALHNLPATRSISFARVIPKLVGKFATVGAATGGAIIAGASYIQYQAGRMSSFKPRLDHLSGR